jgi:spermidine synthase
MKRHERCALALFFFLSGATSLMLQVAWSKELSYLLGNTLYAQATAVAAFMGGLGLGSAIASQFGSRFKNPVRVYAALEFGIAVCAAASIPLFRSLDGVFRTVYALSAGRHELFLLARFCVVFAAMALPVALMGMTLPTLVAVVGRRQKTYEETAGYLYGINTFGAVAGTLLVGFWILPVLGILRTCLAAAVVDVSVALGAWWLGRQVGDVTDLRGGKPVPGSSWTPVMLLVGAAYALTGMAAMIYEIGWLRLLSLILGPSVHAFSIVLSVFLTGLGLGSVVAAKLSARTRNFRDWFAASQAALALAGLLGLALVNKLPAIYSEAFLSIRATWIGPHSYVLAQAITAAVIVFLPAFIMGLMFPLGVAAFRDAAPEGTVPEKAVGTIYALNTAGCIIGSLMAGFFLVPRIGMWRTLALAAGLSLALSVVLWFSGWADATKRATRVSAAAACSVVCAVVYAVLPSFDANNLNQGSYRNLPQKESSTSGLPERDSSLLYYREGVNTTVAVYGRRGLASLHVSGKPDASTLNMDLYTQVFVGHVPMLFAPNHGRAAVIGYGSGTSAGAMLRYPDLESLDVIEIESGIIDASKYFESINHNPLGDPRTNLVLEDGRIHMAYTNKVYDVIASEPSNPWISGISNLFTVDFYHTARRHLASGGIFAQWIQLYQISADTCKAMVASLQQVFPHVAIFVSPPSDAVVLASAEPIRVPWETLQRRFALPGVAADFRQIGMLKPADLLFYFVGSDYAVREFTAGITWRNSDDNVWLEHRMASEFFTVQDNFDARFPEYFPSGKLRGLEHLVADMPLEPVLDDVITYAYSAEPHFAGAGVYDPLARWRPHLLTSIYADLRRMQQAKMISARLQQREQAETERNANAIKAMQLYYRSLNDPAAKRDGSVANRYLDEAMALAPGLAVLTAIRGNQAYAKRDFTSAESFYNQGLDKPWSLAYYDCIIGMAYVYAQRGDTNHTLAMLERARAFNPYLPEAYQLTAEVYKQKRNLDKAAEVVRFGLAANPHDSSLRTMARELAAIQGGPRPAVHDPH